MRIKEVKNQEDLQKFFSNLVFKNKRVQSYSMVGSDFKVSYPAIIYELNKYNTKYANNSSYFNKKTYSCKFITSESNFEVIFNWVLENIIQKDSPNVKFIDNFVFDGLTHIVFNITL